MALPTFFKQNKHKQFNYIPRYYDPQKEELEERIRQIEAEEGIRPEGYTPGIRKGQMRNYYERNKHTRNYSSIRLLIIAGLLVFIAYYLFFR
ncbi:MAG: hypothetical protein JXB49_11875 [Bacteroidales bacterium]|nr:hypothetical protein [Bacteroidales bacterium]